ncbi:hypothetical protein GYN21_03950 [Lactococcus piscium]|uniref:Phage protein n=1 Tax=Pseudolactococcus carnosus TaxID=2749961 RepID=A0ABT0ARP7_9LACT|nr:hypothetical protein [Lactococcus carnosus]
MEITNIPISPKHDVFGNYTPSFDDYLVETINKKFGEPSYLENDAPPALDFAYDYFQNDEKMFVLSIIQFVRSFSSAVRIRTNKNKEIIIHNDRLVETYEDYYYDALLALYLAYSMN